MVMNWAVLIDLVVCPYSEHNLVIDFVSPLFPDLQGTRISSQTASDSEAEAVKTPAYSVSISRDVNVWSLSTVEMWHTVGFLSKIFAIFAR